MKRTAQAWLFVMLGSCFGLPCQALVILQYHHISDTTPPSTSTSPDLFRQHLELIEDAGFKVLSLTDVTQMLRDQAPLPDNAVLITFDDSYHSIYTTAFPLLKARRWPFAVFANTAPIGSGGQFLRWDQLKDMADNGAAIANHSVDHTHFARRPDSVPAKVWQAQVRNEILAAERTIEHYTGQSHRVLAFPYGEFDASLLATLKDQGFLGMSQASGAVRTEDALALPRFPMGGRFGNLDDLKLKLRALPLPLEAVEIRHGKGRKLKDGVLPDGVDKPVLQLTLTSDALAQGLQCYASGQRDAISKIVDGRRVLVQADQGLPAGRSRYNCTARDDSSGRYYWYSRPFLRRDQNGQYPPES